MSASLFGPGSPVNANSLGTIVPQTFTATASQTLFNITSFTYTPGTGSLIVYINGVEKFTGRDYVETSSTSFTLNTPVSAGTLIDIYGFPGVGIDYNGVFTNLAATTGAGKVGFDWSILYTDGSIGKALRASNNKISVLKYIPITLWAGLIAGTETSNMQPYIAQAQAEAAASGGGVIMLPSWTLCISTAITSSTSAVGFDGGIPKEGITASAARGCSLKWTGSVGATMMSFTQGAHNCFVDNIHFDANDKANTCLGFITTGGASPQILHTPRAHNLRFIGYRAAALVIGNPDLSILDAGQLQMCTLTHLSWWGGGPTAIIANVFGMTLNAQNCEIANCTNLYFDPYTLPFGGTGVNHFNHIKVKTGGLNLRGVIFTRADDYDILVNGECGLVIDQARTEDSKFLSMVVGQPSNPVSISNVEGRDGTATGAEIFITIGGALQSLSVKNVKSTGHIQFPGAVFNNITTENITFVFPGISAVAVTGGTPYAGKYDLKTAAGEKVVINTSAKEEWKDTSNNRLYLNDAGKIHVKSLQRVGASAQGNNFGGTAQISGAATSVTTIFAVQEPDAAYRLLISPLAETGAPVAGSNRVKTNVVRNQADFTFSVEVAPGVGSSVTFSWLLFRS